MQTHSSISLCFKHIEGLYYKHIQGWYCKHIHYSVLSTLILELHVICFFSFQTLILLRHEWNGSNKKLIDNGIIFSTCVKHLSGVCIYISVINDMCQRFLSYRMRTKYKIQVYNTLLVLSQSIKLFVDSFTHIVNHRTSSFLVQQCAKI